MEPAHSSPKRFRVALSFAGERRAFVEEVAHRLANELGRGRVLYDRYYEAEFARPDLDTYLQRLYHDQSELLVVFISADYERKEWCGLEWRAVRDLIKKRLGDTVMPLRFDDTEVPGLFSTDGYVWIANRESREVADLILERLKIKTDDVASRAAGAPAPHKPVHLPYPSLGSLFRGREAQLEELRASLVRTSEGHATAIVGKAVHGLGGVGKTRLAVEYAWRHLEEHSALLFIPADTPESLRRNLAALSHPLVLDLLEHQAPEEELRGVAVLRWLQENPGWLLILDNVDTEETAAAAEEVLNHLSSGQVLITSRLSSWSPNIDAHELDVLGEEAATDFLLARTEPRRRKTDDDETHAGSLAAELGYLALALEQAAAYILHHRLSFPRYLDAWRCEHDRVLEWYDERVMKYPRSVAVTWQTSFHRLSEPARSLLQRLAWLAPDPIPESLLDTPVEAEDPSGARAALAELESCSLVTRAEGSPIFTVHRLVQDVSRRSQKGDLVPPALVEALGWIDAAFVGDPQDVRAWPTLDPLAPHLHALVRHADAKAVAEPTASLMTLLGVLNGCKARYFESEALLRRALHIHEKSFGNDYPLIAIDLNSLALLLMDTNRHIEAEPLLHRALEIDEGTFGPDHPNVATSLCNLAQLLKDTNRHMEAEPLMRRALAIDEHSLGPNHPDVAIGLNNLALLFYATDRHAEAESLMRQALKIDEHTYGPDHPNVARDLGNLAQLLKHTDNLPEAEHLLRLALDMDERSFGPDHPSVALRLTNLAACLQETNRLPEAEPLLRRALRIEEQSFGPDNPNVATCLNNLALLLEDTDRLSEAEPLLRRHLEILFDFTRRTGHEHPRVQLAIGSYTHLLKIMGKTEAEIRTTLANLTSLAARCADPLASTRPPATTRTSVKS